MTTNNEEMGWMLIGVVIGLLSGIVFMGTLLNMPKNDQYRQGQIDALTGKVHYELMMNADSTKTWEYKEN